MSVIDLIRRSHETGISHPEALVCVVKLAKVASAAGNLMPHLLATLPGRSPREVEAIEALSDSLSALGVDE